MADSTNNASDDESFWEKPMVRYAMYGVAGIAVVGAGVLAYNYFTSSEDEGTMLEFVSGVTTDI